MDAWTSFFGGTGPNSGGSFQGGRTVSVQSRSGGGGTGTNSMGGATAGDTDLINALQAQWDAARAANAARLEKMLGLAKQFGAGQLANSADLYTKQLAQGTGSLISRGLFNSTTLDANRLATQKAKAQRDLDIKGQRAGLKMNVLQQQQDVYPDLNLMASLFSRPR